MWDPTTYLRFADERSRPFFDLLARVDADDPGTIVDLGCGPGTLTAHLAQRWPRASVVGLDSSPEMIAAAQQLAVPIRFATADVKDWHATPDVGLVVANAVLQWVPGHDGLLARWVGELRPGAQVAFQVPGNFDAGSHRAIREAASAPRWRDRLDGLVRGTDAVLDPTDYASLLVGVGCDVDAWETTYLHQLPATGEEHPVLRWIEGTALRGVRSTLDDDDWAGFLGTLRPLLEVAYPVRDGRVYFPFRRIFVVARR
jgi:trans-aconitate 2-methyltransferase